ncbi:very long chain fatty acid elongase 7 [Halyomorpha halys]|uniref:very long chain fatty acid elongase 7 n=1 Tax=Halyomorpha halys TaxID=286706 RepID=UPI0006D4ECA6|nr:elongation of very long chain fatty acids protein 7-like [Halyomorpha halys]
MDLVGFPSLHNVTFEPKVLEHFPPLMVDHHHVFIVITFYLVAIKVFGPWLMNDRKPLQLKKSLMVYNIFQILMNSHLLYLYSLIMGRRVVDFWGDVCHPATTGVNKYDPKIQSIILEANYYYYINKIIDLLDTIFFTLRKKQSQITFLHLFHHTTMVFSTWLSIIHIRDEVSVLFAGLNSTVHIVMYVYYLLSSLGPGMQKYLWWKKYITGLQIGQFLIALSVLIKMKLINCKNNQWFWLLWTCNLGVFLALFLNFYVKSYIKKKQM